MKKLIMLLILLAIAAGALVVVFGWDTVKDKTEDIAQDVKDEIDERTDTPEPTPSPAEGGCNSYFWFDDSTTECGQKEFCGEFMYQGLRTFGTAGECQEALGSVGPEPTPTSEPPSSPVPGDHGDTAEDATVIQPGQTLTGWIEPVGDEDWFAFSAYAGTVYRIDASPWSLDDPLIRLVDQDGITRLITDESRGNGDDARIEWRAPAAGIYFFSISAGGAGSTGAYRVSLNSQTDDHANSAVEATSINVGSAVSGVLETQGDDDWFSFATSAESVYRISINLGSLLDSSLTLLGHDGVTRLRTDDNSGAGQASFIEWRAPASATYYLRVNSPSGLETGTYGLTVSVEGLEDDYSNSDVGVAQVEVGSPVMGEIETVGDEDWFLFSVTPTARYRIALESITLPTLRMELFGAVIIDEEIRQGIGHAGGVTRCVEPAPGVVTAGENVTFDGWSTYASGPHFIRVTSNHLGSIGGYRLNIEQLPEWGIEDLTSGGTYEPIDPSLIVGQFEITQSCPPDSMVITNAPIRNSSGTQSATSVVVGSTVNGALDSGGDEDWFAFSGKAGTTYQVNVTPGTLADPFLRQYDRSESLISEGCASGCAAASPEAWTHGAPQCDSCVMFLFAPSDSTYYFTASDRSGASAGDYAVTVMQAQPIDHGGIPALATSMDVGSTAIGYLTDCGDDDWFSFPAEKGWVYRLETTDISVDDTDLSLYSFNGISLDQYEAARALEYDYDSGEGKASRIEWVAPETGTFYVRVDSRLYSGNPCTGIYTLTVAGERDDHGNGPSQATGLTLDAEVADYATITGDLETKGDEDWFAFEANEGWVYRLGTASISLDDSDLTLFSFDSVPMDPEEPGARLQYDYDSGEGKASRIEWIAPERGTYYVRVDSRFYSGNTGRGTYTLTVSGEPDDHSNTGSGATEVIVGDAASGNIPVAGYLEVSGDEDWFVFEAVQGDEYVIETGNVSLADSDISLYSLRGVPPGEYDSTRPLKYDYDSGENKAARMEWVAPETGTYHLQIDSRNYSGNPRVGSYTLAVTRKL